MSHSKRGSFAKYYENCPSGSITSTAQKPPMLLYRISLGHLLADRKSTLKYSLVDRHRPQSRDGVCGRHKVLLKEQSTLRGREGIPADTSSRMERRRIDVGRAARTTLACCVRGVLRPRITRDIIYSSRSRPATLDAATVEIQRRGCETWSAAYTRCLWLELVRHRHQAKHQSALCYRRNWSRVYR